MKSIHIIESKIMELPHAQRICTYMYSNMTLGYFNKKIANNRFLNI